MAAHAKAVMRLYRQALQHQKSWSYDALVFRQHQISIRARFEEHKTVPSFKVARDLLQAGQDELAAEVHPDKYKPNIAVEGTKWERNMRPRADVCAMTEEETEWYNDKGNWV